MRRFLGSLVLVLAASSAHAETRPMNADAKVQLDKGLDKFNAHDYAAAIAAFDAGYAIDPHPDFLYAKAQAQRLSGDCRAAVVTYQAFLASEPPATEAGLAKSNITKCEGQIAVAKPIEPDPTGQHDDPQRHQDPPHREDHVDRGDDAPAWHDGAGLVLGVGGVLALAGAGVAAWRSSVAADAATHALTIDDWIVGRDAWQQDRTIAGIAAGVGGALVLASVIRFAYVGRQSSVTTAAIPARGGGVVVLGGAW